MFGLPADSLYFSRSAREPGSRRIEKEKLKLSQQQDKETRETEFQMKRDQLPFAEEDAGREKSSHKDALSNSAICDVERKERKQSTRCTVNIEPMGILSTSKLGTWHPIPRNFSGWRPAHFPPESMAKQAA